MFYADVNGKKCRPEPGMAGVCPGCRGLVIPKCGTDVAWHWAHKVGRDCDPWSEPIGPWHISWQDLVRPERAEVQLGPHRADMVGNDGVVVELQHSPISAEDIAEREAFYGEMVWLFDATYRFRMVATGDRGFFSFGRVKHVLHCTKPVLLDFGEAVLEVETFTSVLAQCSGFGTIRDRQWFIARYLSQSTRERPHIYVAKSDDPCPSNPWEQECPYSTTTHPTKWLHPSTGHCLSFPKGTPFIHLDYDWRSTAKGRRPVWHDVIDQHPAIANGWTKDEFRRMREFLDGTPMIFNGQLSLMPSPADRIPINSSVSSVEYLLKQVDEHIAKGRIPVLKDETRQALIDRATQFEIVHYGRQTSRRAEPRRREEANQRRLFE